LQSCGISHTQFSHSQQLFDGDALGRFDVLFRSPATGHGSGYLAGTATHGRCLLQHLHQTPKQRKVWDVSKNRLAACRAVVLVVAAL